MTAEYFVTYRIPGGFTGDIVIEVTQPITSAADIGVVKEAILEKRPSVSSIREVVITFIFLLRAD